MVILTCIYYGPYPLFIFVCGVILSIKCSARHMPSLLRQVAEHSLTQWESIPSMTHVPWAPARRPLPSQLGVATYHNASTRFEENRTGISVMYWRVRWLTKKWLLTRWEMHAECIAPSVCCDGLLACWSNVNLTHSRVRTGSSTTKDSIGGLLWRFMSYIVRTIPWQLSENLLVPLDNVFSNSSYFALRMTVQLSD